MSISMPRLSLCLLTLVFLAGGGRLAHAEQAPADPASIAWKKIPAEESGLSHVLNSDPSLGELKYSWMSPPVDINADGHLDLIVYGHHGGGAAVWLGDGRGKFAFDRQGYADRWQFGGRDPVWISLSKPGVVDAIGTEGYGVAGRIFLNTGDGHWQKTNLVLPGAVQLADLDGDGLHEETFQTFTGAALKLTPAPAGAATSTAASQSSQELWHAEQIVGFPAGIERGQGPGRAGYRDAYVVDLDGDHHNEIILHLKGGSGFTSKEVFSWVISSSPDAPNRWQDTTAQRRLPSGPGHWLYPEDIDLDGSLDLVDLHAGHWYRNDGQGRFELSETRVFDPAERLHRRTEHPWTADNEHQWLDLDNNGHRDLVTASDHSPNHGTFLHLGQGRFVETPDVPGGRRNRKFGDINHDGRLDMVTFEKDRLTLHENASPAAGISVRLVPKVPAHGRLGAKLWVYAAGKLGEPAALLDYQQGFMNRDSGRSHNLAPVFHTGLGQHKAVDLRVRFPSGVVKEVRNAPGGTQVEVAEQE